MHFYYCCALGLTGAPGLDGLNGLGGPKGLPGTPGKDLLKNKQLFSIYFQTWEYDNNLKI